VSLGACLSVQGRFIHVPLIYTQKLSRRSSSQRATRVAGCPRQRTRVVLSATAELILSFFSSSSPLLHGTRSIPFPNGVQTSVQASREARRLSLRRDVQIRPPHRTSLIFRRPFHRPPDDRERGTSACFPSEQPCAAGRVPRRGSPPHLLHLLTRGKVQVWDELQASPRPDQGGQCAGPSASNLRAVGVPRRRAARHLPRLLARGKMQVWNELQASSRPDQGRRGLE
jgi:hypothetical protein